ncbi:MAG: ergothioneine biosynthesis protein EgtC [Cyanobacteria bacterium J06554_11]
MCRILGYLGPSVALDEVVFKPPHSLLVQSYKPKELDGAVLNGDGFGLGWHDQPTGESAIGEAFAYRNLLPMWNDRSLADLCRYVRAENFVVNLRSATEKMPVDISNCQPFKRGQLLFVHNGLIENFFESLYRPIREKLGDVAYRSIQGLTDSEHIFALLVDYLERQPGIDLAEALRCVAFDLMGMAKRADVRVAANIVLSTGDRLIWLRYDNRQKAPSLYLLRESSLLPGAVVVSSEPLFEGDWQPCRQGEIMSVKRDLQVKTYARLE